MITLTLDSNVLFSGLDGYTEQKSAFQEIWELHNEEIASIALTSRFDEDKEGDSNLDRVKRHYRIARIFETIPTAFRIDVSMIGQDVIADGEVSSQLESLFGIGSRPFEKHNTMCDVDHLYGHWLAKREYFLTYDKGILEEHEKLAKFGIRVINPVDFAAAILRARQHSGGTGGDLESLVRAELGQASG